VGSLVRVRRSVLVASARRVLLSPGIRVDVDDVTVLSEAVDEGAEAEGVVEHGAPLLEGEIDRDDDGPGLWRRLMM